MLKGSAQVRCNLSRAQTLAPATFRFMHLSRGSKVDEGDAVRWLSIDEQPPVTRVLSAVALASMSTERYKSGHKLIS